MEMQITLPADLNDKVQHAANMRGMSLPDFVRESLERAIAHEPSEDPLFADAAVYRDGGPADCAADHDDYLYGDAS